jgi:hypothetical protein
MRLARLGRCGAVSVAKTPTAWQIVLDRLGAGWVGGLAVRVMRRAPDADGRTARTLIQSWPRTAPAGNTVVCTLT